MLRKRDGVANDAGILALFVSARDHSIDSIKYECNQIRMRSINDDAINDDALNDVGGEVRNRRPPQVGRSPPAAALTNRLGGAG